MEMKQGLPLIHGSRRTIRYNQKVVFSCLASWAALDEILITENVKRGLDHTFAVTQGSSCMLKGLEKEIPVFSVGVSLSGIHFNLAKDKREMS
jgi:hypothetical protein